jgi:hypothetical protein
MGIAGYQIEKLDRLDSPNARSTVEAKEREWWRVPDNWK